MSSTSDDDEAVDFSRDVRFADGETCLSPLKNHVLHRAIVRDDLALATAGCRPGWRMVVFEETGKAYAVPEGRLVKWKGYRERILGASAKTAEKRERWCVWRAEIWVEGLFSMLFWALGFLESAAREQPAGTRLLIDWTDERITFHPTAGTAGAADNCWLAFFEQPPPLREQDAAAGPSAPPPPSAPPALWVTTRFGPPWFAKFGEFRGADTGTTDEHKAGGRLDEAAASEGRRVVSRWIKVSRPIAERVDEAAARLLGPLPRRAWLAVHIRRTDKVAQCPANAVSLDSLVSQSAAFCEALGCSAVLLCSDDEQLKRSVASRLTSLGLQVATHDALLSTRRNQPSHKDSRLDRRRNAEDCLLEVLLMARCYALLSTWSNVSVAAVYFSPPGYRFFMFGDAVPPRAPSTPPEARGTVAGAGRPESSDAGRTGRALVRLVDRDEFCALSPLRFSARGEWRGWRRAAIR